MVLRRLLISVLVALALLGALEAILRATGFRQPVLEVPIVVWNAAEDRLMYTEDYLFEPHERTLWTLRPGAAVQFAEGDSIEEGERINPAGYRGPLLPVQRTPGVLRIATLGDSTTFGIAVPYPQTYSGQLQASLAGRGVACEVLDGGIDGFTVRQGLERYRGLVRAHDPDLVVAAFGCVNEHWPVEDLCDDAKIRRSIARAGWRTRARSWLRTHLRVAHVVSWLRDPRTPKQYWQQFQHEQQQKLAAWTGSEHPGWEGVRRVSVEQFVGDLRQLAREVEADGARLVLVVNPRFSAAETDFPVLYEYTRALQELARQEGLQVLDARGRVRARVDAGVDERELMHDYWHPTAAGHALIAEGLADLVLDPDLNRGADPQGQALD